MRKSFILYTDTLAVLDSLTDEQAGLLFRAIKSYHETGDPGVEGMFAAVFSPFKAQFERDAIKYYKRCKANKSNGLLGGRPKPRKTQHNPLGFTETQHNPLGFTETQHNPLAPDSDSDSDKKKEKNIKKENTIPDWMPKDDWEAFREMRKAIRKPMTARAEQMIINRLPQLKGSPAAILQQSTRNGWQDVFDLREEKNQPKPTQRAGVKTL